MYELKPNVVKLHGYILQNFDIRPSGVASMVLTKELLEEYKVKPAEASLLVGSLRNIEGILAWAFL